ncbi:MAG: hypothetical protein JWM87_292 [Candidatus Eremiobacteraeota bacterium]|nr:hypothetical protein [Candidatus Eremiobacteraeota bacterium]
MDRRTAVQLSLAVLGVSAAFVLSASSGAPAAEEENRVIDQDVDLAGIRSVTIHAGSGSVHVRPTLARRQAQSHPGDGGAGGAAPGGGASMHVHAELRATREELASAVRVSREGDSVTVVFDEQAQRRGGWFSIFSRTSWRAATYEILLAADVDLSVQTGSGSVAVDAPPRTLHAGTGSGSIAVTDARDAVELRAGSGSIRVYEPHGAVDAHMGSGSVDVRGAASSVDVRTGSGSVNAVLRDGWNGDAVRMETGSGSVRLAVPRGFRAAVHTTTGSGSVTDAAHVIAAASPVVSLRSSSGSVRIVTAGG